MERQPAGGHRRGSRPSSRGEPAAGLTSITGCILSSLLAQHDGALATAGAGERGHLPRSLADAGADEIGAAPLGCGRWSASATYLDQFGSRFGHFEADAMHDHDHQLTADRSTCERRLRAATRGAPDDDRPPQASLADSSHGDRVLRLSRPFPCRNAESGISPTASYHGDPRTPHEQAQQEQVEWLLDQVHCQRGTRLLEIGCGNGRLLRAAARGAEAIGVNVSRLQVEHRRATGLDARLMDYREIDETWNGRFRRRHPQRMHRAFRAGRGRRPAAPTRSTGSCSDLPSGHRSGIAVAADGHHDDPSQRAHPQACSDEVTKGPFAFLPFSDKFHYAMVTRCFGGSYPHPGQFERCASPYFRLLGEVDGTLDYHPHQRGVVAARPDARCCSPAQRPSASGRECCGFWSVSRVTRRPCGFACSSPIHGSGSSRRTSAHDAAAQDVGIRNWHDLPTGHARSGVGPVSEKITLQQGVIGRG